METLCTRCHQPVIADTCFCPSCGLPQLVYTVDGPAGPEQQEQWNGSMQDARSVNWKMAMRGILPVALLAGLLCSDISPVSGLRVLWISLAAIWSVVFYMRSQRPAWITRGAGARIGFVLGMIAIWLSFGISSSYIFSLRHFQHQGSQMDAAAIANMDTQMQLSQKFLTDAGFWNQSFVEAQQIQKAIPLTPFGRAGLWLSDRAVAALWLLVFATTGGAIGARLMAHTIRPKT